MNAKRQFAGDGLALTLHKLRDKNLSHIGHKFAEHIEALEGEISIKDKENVVLSQALRMLVNACRRVPNKTPQKAACWLDEDPNHSCKECRPIACIKEALTRAEKTLSSYG